MLANLEANPNNNSVNAAVKAYSFLSFIADIKAIMKIKLFYS